MRLQREVEKFGNPPKFPVEQEGESVFAGRRRRGKRD